MLHIQLPDILLQQIEAAGVTGSGVDAFVEQAVREKLAIANLNPTERRSRFFKLSDEMRTAMHEQGLTEEQLLAEFNAQSSLDLGEFLVAEPVAVDATCLVSAILGGLAREIVFSEQFELYSPQTTLFQVPKHITWLANRLQKPELKLFEEFQLFPITACQPENYEPHVQHATQLIGQRDPLDIPLLALAPRGYPLWSDDRDFEGIDEIQLVKTADLLLRLAPQ